MPLFHDPAGALPLTAMKAVRLEDAPWHVMTPDLIAYALFGGLAVILLYVFSR